MKLGGPKPVINAVKKAGGEVGPSTIWIGAWNLKSGYGGLETFYKECKTSGTQPLVHFWFWGDDISPKAIVDGVQDNRQGVFKNWPEARKQAATIARLAKAAGVEPIVTMESEFNKAGAEASTKTVDYFWDMLNTMRTELPGIKLVFAPGLWGNLKALATDFRDVARSMDYIGVQCVKFPPRHGDYTNEPQRIKEGLAILRSTIGNKPTCLHDVALSTYAGGDRLHPFAGGDGSAYDAQQAKTLAALGGMDVEFMVYRDLKDNPTFALSNYGGWAERHVGVIRSDGTKKPGHDELISLSLPPNPDSPTPGEEMQERLDSIATTVDSLSTRLDEMHARQDEAERRMQQAGSALRGGDSA